MSEELPVVTGIMILEAFKARIAAAGIKPATIVGGVRSVNKKRKEPDGKSTTEHIKIKRKFAPRKVDPSPEDIALFEADAAGKPVPGGRLEGTHLVVKRELGMRLFISKITALGGRAIGFYRATHTPVLSRCPKGHMCWPRLYCLNAGHGMCEVCAGNSPIEAKRLFMAKMKEIGATVKGVYVDKKTPIHVICKNGHDCNPTWTNAQSYGICKICVGLSPIVAAAEFESKVKDLGGRLIGKYVNNREGVKAECKNKHICWPIWDMVNRGQGMCRVCAQRDPATASKLFHSRITEMGGKLIGEYRGTGIPVAAVCPIGHNCFPRWQAIQSGQGMCWECSGTDPKIAEKEFKIRVLKQNGVLIGEYVNCDTRVEVKCPEGHTCYPQPRNVLYQNGGICAQCRETKGERRLREIFEELGIKMEPQLSIDSRRRYDFMNDEAVAEFDGGQHFEDIPYFKSTTLAERHLADIEKTLKALATRRRVFRFHDSFLDEDDAVQVEFVRACFASKNLVVVYKPEHYKWLEVGGIVVTEPDWSGKATSTSTQLVLWSPPGIPMPTASTFTFLTDDSDLYPVSKT